MPQRLPPGDHNEALTLHSRADTNGGTAVRVVTRKCLSERVPAIEENLYPPE